MKAPYTSAGGDPRAALKPDDLAGAGAAGLTPVSMPVGISPGLAMGFLGILLLGAFTFMSLASSRDEIAVPAASEPVAQAPVAAAPPPTLPPPTRSFVPGPPELPAPRLVRPGPSRFDDGSAAAARAEAQRLAAPAIVIDRTTAGDGPRLADGPNAAADAAARRAELGVDEKFADRVANAEFEPALATRMPDMTDVVPQGSVIAGVLETAINSDLPGFVRAVVSRDVMGFDGTKTLIPMGSRLIGQYRSGINEGQSRAFVVWTRLVRPDGVTISLDSPATDTLGRAGLTGKVNTHFLKRFGSAILLSVIQSGLDLLQDDDGATIIRNAGDAQSVAGIALQRNIDIPPTIKVKQGKPIRIFVARDLNFAGAGSVR
ncbi:MAG: type IV secretion system protein VirB10 [Pseudomonadota bacterium]